MPAHTPPRADAALTLEEQVLVELRRLIRATQLSSKRLARDAGLTPSQLLVLNLLREQQEMTQREIAHAMNLTQATVSTLLDRLQARGLIHRQRGDTDRRTLHVALTARGLERLAAAPPSLQERFVAGFAALAPWEQTAILSALQRLSSLMDVAELDAAPVLQLGAIDKGSEIPE